MNYEDLTFEEIKNGYHRNDKEKTYICNYCHKAFPDGQVFPIDEFYYESEYAASAHIETDHQGNFKELIDSDTKYNTLTDTQRQLLKLFNAGLTDSEIAKELDISPSTVRHQKFTFREKAKQAKLYLAIYENAFSESTKVNSAEDIVPIHDHANYYDDKYVITQKERDQILKTTFESLSPLRLKHFPAKDKKKVVVLTKIAELFEAGKDYTEKEINAILMPVYDEYIIIRRYLIEYGFIDREADGSKYWLK